MSNNNKILYVVYQNNYDTVTNVMMTYSKEKAETLVDAINSTLKNELGNDAFFLRCGYVAYNIEESVIESSADEVLQNFKVIERIQLEYENGKILPNSVISNFGTTSKHITGNFKADIELFIDGRYYIDIYRPLSSDSISINDPNFISAIDQLVKDYQNSTTDLA